MSHPTEWDVIAEVRALHLRMLVGLRAQLLSAPITASAAVTGVQGGDVVYRIDRKGEELLVEWCEEQSRTVPFLLIAEGISESGERVFPAGADPETVPYRVIVDPIDGTRGLMYDKRSAWILTGVAPNRGAETSLADLRWAVMTEVPTTRARYADQLWGEAGEDTTGLTYDLVTDVPTAVRPVHLAPSRATDLRHGFASLVKYFPGGKELTARLEEALFEALLGPPEAGIPQAFDDQYISTGGQLYELMMGHDRFTADLRPILLPHANPHEPTPRLTAHPYDLCTELLARGAGVIVTGGDGQPLNAPLNVHHPTAWIAYANRDLQQAIQPTLQRLMVEFGLTA